MRRALLVLAALAVVVTASCGAGDDDDVAGTRPTVTDGTTPPTASATASTVADRGSLRPDGTLVPVTEPSTSSSSEPPGRPATAEESAAVADLAARRGVDAAAITVIAVEEVTWRSGAIGCPEAGVAYTDALVPGVRVVLELDGSRSEYHAGGGRAIFLCEQPEPPAER